MLISSHHIYIHVRSIDCPFLIDSWPICFICSPGCVIDHSPVLLITLPSYWLLLTLSCLIDSLLSYWLSPVLLTLSCLIDSLLSYWSLSLVSSDSPLSYWISSVRYLINLLVTLDNCSTWVQPTITRIAELPNWQFMNLEKTSRLVSCQHTLGLCHLCLLAQEMCLR